MPLNSRSNKSVAFEERRSKIGTICRKIDRSVFVMPNSLKTSFKTKNIYTLMKH